MLVAFGYWSMFLDLFGMFLNPTGVLLIEMAFGSSFHCCGTGTSRSLDFLPDQ